jgi:hypothetical protein
VITTAETLPDIRQFLGRVMLLHAEARFSDLTPLSTRRLVKVPLAVNVLRPSDDQRNVNIGSFDK